MAAALQMSRRHALWACLLVGGLTLVVPIALAVFLHSRVWAIVAVLGTLAVGGILLGLLAGRVPTDDPGQD